MFNGNEGPFLLDRLKPLLMFTYVLSCWPRRDQARWRKVKSVQEQSVTYWGRRLQKVRGGQDSRVKGECEECCLQTWILKAASKERYHLRICRVMVQGQSYRISDINENSCPKVNFHKFTKRDLFWRCSAVSLQSCRKKWHMIFIIQDNTEFYSANYYCKA